jgi:hypothetical protein
VNNSRLLVCRHVVVCIVLVTLASLLLQACTNPSTPAREILAVCQKHRDFLKKVRAIHASSLSEAAYWARIDSEHIAQEYKSLVLEFRRVNAANMPKLSAEELTMVEREGAELNKLYLDMSGEGIRFQRQVEWF